MKFIVGRFCDVLDVTLLRMSHCPLDAGVHSVTVKPTVLGFADRASRHREHGESMVEKVTVVSRIK